ncbi:MAG: tetratricopeptide repeat protein [Parachlamydiaceae bacterium]|nr:tetratricopeptide repeat protein [Parachlamydiaceae bacterium]
MSRINWRNELKWTEEHLDDLRNTGYAYLRQGKYDIAISFFEALSVLDPESAYDVQTLGALHLQLGNPAKALKWLDRALKIETDHGPTLLNLCKALFMLGKKEEAIKLAHILKNEPNLTISNSARALILAHE